MRGIGSFLKDAYRLAKPYFARSDERLFAWGMLIAIIVAQPDHGGDVGDPELLASRVLQRDPDQELAGVPGTPVHVSPHAKRPDAGICRARGDLDRHRGVRGLPEPVAADPLATLDDPGVPRRWLSDRAYYHISLATDTAAIGTDNPDQRIAEDLRDFTRSTLSLGLSLLSNVVSLFSFLTILWGLSGSITLFGINIPGYMVWVALIYSVLGTWLTHLVGRPLAAMNFRQQRVEADFRYALVRVRENVEGIALYHGEKEEQELLYERFSSVIGNWWAIMRRLRWLNALIAGYSQLASIFPIVVAAPRYFFGTMELGDLMQTVGAFGQVQGAMSWIIDQYSANNPNEVSLARWRSIVERLSTFDRAVVVARATAGRSR